MQKVVAANVLKGNHRKPDYVAMRAFGDESDEMDHLRGSPAAAAKIQRWRDTVEASDRGAHDG
jgi:hypothetical protein